MAIEDVAVTLKADLTDNGVFETDWSSFLRRYSVDVGRATAVDRFSPRRASLILDNTDSRFSPRNTSSPYSPNLKRGKRVQLAATITLPAVTNLFKNPSVETNLTTFAGAFGATIDRIQAAARFGKFGVETTRGVIGTYGISQATGLAPDAATYTLALYVKGVGTSVGLTVEVQLTASGGAGGNEIATSSAMALTTGWQRLDVSLTVTAGDHTDLTGVVFRTSAGAGEIFYSDAWQVAKESSVSIYCDGDQPKGVWSATEHASTSSRVANPAFNLFTGELREFNVGRTAQIPEAAFVASGQTEGILRTLVSAGPFTRKPANLILNRVMDIIESEISESFGLVNEIIPDGAHRFGGNSYVALGGATVNETFDTGAAGDDPVVYDALEGDNVCKVSGIDAEGDGAEIEVTADVENNRRYHVSFFIRTPNSAEAGKRVRLRVRGEDSSQVVKQEITIDVELIEDTWVYGDSQVQFTDSSITKYFVSVEARDGGSGGSWSGSLEFWFDGLHMTGRFFGLTTSIVPFETIGTKWTTELEYLDAFERGGGSLLEELAKSVGGWFYEDGDGTLVFEDYSQRDNAVISTPKLRLSDVPQDGHPYDLTSYEEPATSLAGVVRVGSFGDVTAQKAPSGVTSKVIWMLEPIPVTLAAGEVRTFAATYTTEGESGSLIARRAGMAVLPASGWNAEEGVATPWVRNYGRAGEVVLRNGGTNTVLALVIGARIQNRETTERSFITFGGGVTPIMELDMPAQGFKTTAMNNLLIWALVKYNASSATMEAVLTGASLERLLEIFGRGIGLPVWVRHVQGPGNLAVDALFYVEGIKMEYTAGHHPRLRLTLEEGT